MLTDVCDLSLKHTQHMSKRSSNIFTTRIAIGQTLY
jgi:hypothetical protein